MNSRADIPKDVWIDELESDLGQAAALRLIANLGGQRRDIPLEADGSVLSDEVGIDIVRWLARRFGGTKLSIPSARGREQQDRANQLRAAILEGGLFHPRRTANDIAVEFGVTSDWVRILRGRMRRECDRECNIEPEFPFFDEN